MDHTHPFSEAALPDLRKMSRLNLDYITPDQIRKDITGEIYGGNGYVGCRLSTGTVLEAHPHHDHGGMVAAWQKRYTIAADYRS